MRHFEIVTTTAAASLSYHPPRFDGITVYRIWSNHTVLCLIPLLLLCFVVIYGVKNKS